jgi:hypothetical protein
MAARLNERDLYSLVRTLYRGLQKVYHPDRAGARGPEKQEDHADRTVELNLAFESLNLDKNPESFRRCHRLYAARRKRGLSRQITELQGELGRSNAERDGLADGYMAYLVRGLPWLSGQDGYAPPNPMAPTNLKVGLNDVAITQNVRTASWTLGSNYKEIVFDALGTLFYRPVGRAKPFQANYIHLLGVIPTDQIDLVPILDRVPPREGFFKSPALDARYGIDGAPLEVLNTLGLAKFKRYCLPLLRPDFTERSFLFSIHRPLFEKEGLVSVEGVIVKITNL